MLVKLYICSKLNFVALWNYMVHMSNLVYSKWNMTPPSPKRKKKSKINGISTYKYRIQFKQAQHENENIPRRISKISFQNFKGSERLKSKIEYILWTWSESESESGTWNVFVLHAWNLSFYGIFYLYLLKCIFGEKKKKRKVNLLMYTYILKILGFLSYRFCWFYFLRCNVN